MMSSFLKSIAVRRAQGSQYIPDLTTAVPGGYRACPTIAAGDCAPGCTRCLDACPSGAIALDPLRIDLGRCVFCGDCEPACPAQRIGFSSQHKLAATERDALTVSTEHPRINGCEMELNAVGNVNFDFGRYGVDFVASPRHADGLVLSGPVTRNMAAALEICWDAMPEPKLLIAVGACAISGGVFTNADADADADGIDRAFLERVKPSLYLPGCPCHPLTLINGIMQLLGIDA
jgi:Ni,Fe-hydrogenase III small subunit/NAD-dependent dihydropyrimidine dehydrogenase PreA subunit